MSMERIGSPFALSDMVSGSQCSVHDIYGGVNIGYMPGDGFVSDVVGDDVQYEANRIVAADMVATLGRKSVSSSMNDVGGSVPAMTQGSVAPKGGKYGIGSLRMEVFVTDRESASECGMCCEKNSRLFSDTVSQFVGGNVYNPMKWRNFRHVYKNDQSFKVDCL